MSDLFWYQRLGKYRDLYIRNFLVGRFFEWIRLDDLVRKRIKAVLKYTDKLIPYDVMENSTLKQYEA